MAAVQKFQSPKGEFEWVTIDGEGKENLSGKMQYLVSVIVEADDPVIAKIEDFWASNKPKGFKKEAKSLGIYPHKSATGEKDEDGKNIFEEDGKMVLSFKTGTTFPDGSAKKVQVYNAKAQKVELPADVKIGNGSIGQVAGAMGLYVNKTKQGNVVDAGVTLYLDSVKISKLVEFTTDAGFDADDDEDGGWSGDEGWSGAAEESEPATEKAKPRL